jgi:hypothetical protein
MKILTKRIDEREILHKSLLSELHDPAKVDILLNDVFVTEPKAVDITITLDNGNLFVKFIDCKTGEKYRQATDLPVLIRQEYWKLINKYLWDRSENDENDILEQEL